MINSIVELFKNQAREHRSIKSFYYNRNYELGSGKEQHPVFWLEDPILGQNKKNVFECSVNFSILFIPKDDDEVLTFQNRAFSIGLNILERINQTCSEEITILPLWNYITLRNYYDNNSCGCRFSVNLSMCNTQNLCLIEEQFEATKSFELTKKSLHDFSLFNSSSSEVFKDKLPVFDLKVSKK